MLKGLLLSVLVIAVWGIVQLVVFHTFHPRNALKSMIGSFLPFLPAYLLLYLATPPTFSILPDRLAATAVPLGMLNGMLILILLFLTCVQFYYHLNRAISLRILIEFERAAGRSMTLNQIEHVCGLGSLIGGRLEALVTYGFVFRSGEYYHFALGGRIAAAIGRIARKVIRLRLY